MVSHAVRAVHVRARRSDAPPARGVGVGGVELSRVPARPGSGGIKDGERKIASHSPRDRATPPTPTPRTGRASRSHVERLSQHATPIQDGVVDFDLVFSKSFFKIKI